ncbi:hypothetical protein KSP39_PZI014616 [Platanthera zijinensis]|uniref:Uncharacterized protein n=1 Tax=Platanthera zijinensis TaxID=2320716 RepID=A0AAP0BA53_9ASPA
MRSGPVKRLYDDFPGGHSSQNYSHSSMQRNSIGDEKRRNFIVKRAQLGLVPGWVTSWEVPISCFSKSLSLKKLHSIPAHPPESSFAIPLGAGKPSAIRSLRPGWLLDHGLKRAGGGYLQLGGLQEHG